MCGVGTVVAIVVGVVVVVALVVVGVAVAARISAKRTRDERTRRAQETASVMTPDGRVSPSAIKVGDVVAIKGVEHLVVGSVRYDEDGFEWREHLIEDVDRRWLSVEDDEGLLETVLWRQVKGSSLEPGPARVTHDGIDYDLDERGRATYTTAGVTGLPPRGQAEYADYVGPDGRRLGFERYTSGSWELATGTLVHPADLVVWTRSADA